jgi:glycosyltransferase involved in cell wall biosynthesis
MKLSIIIPAYNEEKTILKILGRIDKVKLPWEKEVIIVDDASTDKTREILKNIKDKKVVYHNKNMGKGHAIRTALEHSHGDIIIIQDADLEYYPKDYRKLIKPIIEGKAEVVYGSRLLGKSKPKISYMSFYLGGIFLSKLANLLYRTTITDESTCYKVFKKEAIKNLDLKCERFEFCPEVTAKLSRKGVKILEVPISYTPRKKEEGKKIRGIDGLVAIWTLVKYRFKR